MKLLLVLLALAGCADGGPDGGRVTTSLHGTYSAYGGVIAR